MPGFFITLEGADLVGKTTQMHHIMNYLRKNGYTALETCEPGGTELGWRLRQILLEPAMRMLDPMAELFLYAADRAQHVHEKIKPALERGQIVLSDRYVDSAYVYQCIAGGVAADTVEWVIGRATDGLMPDLTILLDMPDAAWRKRWQSRHHDRIEGKEATFHEHVRQGYRDLAKKYPERIKLVRSDRHEMSVYQDIIQIIQARLPQEVPS